jgi:hypothetical protein
MRAGLALCGRAVTNDPSSRDASRGVCRSDDMRDPNDPDPVLPTAGAGLLSMSM